MKPIIKLHKTWKLNDQENKLFDLTNIEKQSIMKKITFLLIFILAIKILHADPNVISLSFSAEHGGTPVDLDSIYMENLTQGASMVIYDDHVILTSEGTGIIPETYNNLYVSQNYPNPFSEQTTINVFTPERDHFNLEVFDLTGKRLTNYEITLEHGIHQFTFFACKQQIYVLIVNSGKFMQQRLMIQIGKGSSSFSRIAYIGAFAENKTQFTESDAGFPYEPGDELRFTGYVTSTYGNTGFDVITDAPTSDVEYVFNIFFPLYTLTLSAEPETGGTLIGGGEYEESQEVIIEAISGEGYEFIAWTGHTDYLDDPETITATVTMPGYDISIVANFQEEEPGYGTVTDIDGNVYQTVIIGDQEWMAENLRVTKYNNGEAIPTSLSDDDWGNTTSGAYIIYPHEMVNGINSTEEMVEAYGKLYNWFAADDQRGLCPAGWYLPGKSDWEQLLEFVDSQGFPNDGDNPDGSGNAIKSCRQVNSPLGGDCNTTEHPRWNMHATHFGFDEFGFSALPAGRRNIAAVFANLGIYGYWWTSTEYSPTMAWSIRLRDDIGDAFINSNFFKRTGYSVRCIKD